LEGGYASQESVLHFKVDEEQKTLLSVSRSGGMTVHAMEDNRVLWKFSPVRVKLYHSALSLALNYYISRTISSAADANSRMDS